MPVMTDYLAWSAQYAVNVTSTTFIHYPAVATFPAMTGLGPQPTLAYCMSYRKNGTWGLSFALEIVVGGTALPNDLDQGLRPLATSGGRYGYCRLPDLSAGGTVDLYFNLGTAPPARHAECLLALALLRDLQGLPKVPDAIDFMLGGAFKEPTDGGGDLTFTFNNPHGSEPLPFDPAPSESIVFYGWDTLTATAANTVTIETHDGWEDAIVATNGPRAALLGLYVPTLPPELVGTATGVASGDVGRQVIAGVAYGVEAPPLLVAVPARLATIVG